MDDVVCRIIELPSRVNAITVVDEDGDYNVYINARLSIEEQRKAYRHEVRHIRKSHFYTDKTVKACELEADKRAT